jgi:hypothetical protein
MPAYAGIQILDSGFRRNDDASVGVLNPIANKASRLSVLARDNFSDVSNHEYLEIINIFEASKNSFTAQSRSFSPKQSSGE